MTLSYRELDVEQLGSLYEGFSNGASIISKNLFGESGWTVTLFSSTEEQLADLRKRRGETGGESPDESDGEDEKTPRKSLEKPRRRQTKHRWLRVRRSPSGGWICIQSRLAPCPPARPRP